MNQHQQNAQPSLFIVQFTLNDVLFDSRMITIDFRLESPIGEETANFHKSTLWLSSPTETEAFFVGEISGELESHIRQLCQPNNHRRVHIESSGAFFLYLSDENGTVAIPLAIPSPARQIDRLKMMLNLERNKASDSMRRVYELQAEVVEAGQKREQVEQLCESQLRDLNCLRNLLREHSNVHEHEMFTKTPFKCLMPMGLMSCSKPPTSQVQVAKPTEQPSTSTEGLNGQNQQNQQNQQNNQSINEEKATSSLLSLSHSIASTTSTVSEKSQKEILIGIAQQIICSLCPESVHLPDLKQMEQHFLQTHVDEEKKSCRACPTERLPPNIYQHMRQHANKIYSCTRCGKRGQKHLIKAHLRTHTGEKPFSCETCGRGFADASTLRRHRMIHTGEKKHECPICGRSIARKDNVKVHIRSHKESGGVEKEF